MDLNQLFKDILHFNLDSLKKRFHKLSHLIKRRFHFLFRKKGHSADLKSIPVIINNRNRLGYLKKLIAWLERNEMINIFIIDNDSTYKPLLQYYQTIPYKIFYLKKNVGHLALWKTGLIKKFEHDYYIYTDPDILPVFDSIKGIKFLMSLLNKYGNIEKAGLGLKIDDLPDHYADKHKVLSWEKQFWLKEVEKDVYDAGVDTTFALYRPYTNGYLWVQHAYRSGGEFIARHLPWYENSEQPGEEENYYKNHVKPGASHWIDPQKEKK